MDLRSLACFLAVAEHLHFGRAAAQLHMTQPALSQRIRALEKQLGVDLFKRDRRHVSLTPAGVAFLEPARIAASQADLAKQAALRAARGDLGTLRLGFTVIAFHQVLPPALNDFRARHPDVVVELVELNSPMLEASLAAGEVDLGLLHPPLSTPGLSTRPLPDVRYRLALPSDHPLAAGDRIELSQLADQPFIVGARKIGPSIHGRTIAWFASQAISPRIVQEAVPVTALLGLVAAGIGMGLVPEGLAELSRPGVAFRDVEPEPPRLPLAAVWQSPSLSPTAERFLESMAESSRM